MNWDAVGAIGQAASAMALVFVIVQVRHARSELRHSVAAGRVDRMIEINMPLVTDERLAALHVKVNEYLEGGGDRPPFIEAATKRLGLTVEQAYSLNVEQFIKWQSLVLNVEYLSELSPAERIQFARSSGITFFEPVFSFWYGLMTPFLNPETVRYLDSLSESNSTPV